MPAFGIKITTKTRGTIFDKAATRSAGRRMITAINKDVAESGVRRIRAHFVRVLQHPTGYLSSQVETALRGTRTIIWDQDIVYGPWIEGTSDRNMTTTFKGYHTFRIVQQRLEKDAPRIAQKHVDRYIREMNK